MENLVADLSYCKQFVELNIKFDSYFMWVKYKMWKKPKIWISDMNEMLKVTCLSGEREYSYPAPTASEIMEKLPEGVTTQKVQDIFLCTAHDLKTHHQYEKDKKMVNSMSLMLIYLKKEKLI